MRSMLISALFLAGIAPAYASLLTFSFSGTWGTSLGVINAGDTFSGTAVWDPSTVGAVVANYAELTSYSFTMPGGDGFTVASIPNAQVLFAGAGYSGSTFTGLQVNERSSADSQVYTFFLGRDSGHGAAFSLGSQGRFASAYTAIGPNAAVPEPATSVSMVIGLSLVTLVLWRTRKNERFSKRISA